MSASQRRRLAAVQETDQVARWHELLTAYPEAKYVTHGGFFRGKLRDQDDTLSHSDLRGLIDQLLAREENDTPR